MISTFRAPSKRREAVKEEMKKKKKLLCS